MMALRSLSLALPVVFMASFAGHAVWVHVFYFLPAQQEWEAAHAVHDYTGMWAAFGKEMEASRRCSDPLWMFR